MFMTVGLSKNLSFRVKQSGIEESWHDIYCKCKLGAKIPPLPSVGRDDRCFLRVNKLSIFNYQLFRFVAVGSGAGAVFGFEGPVEAGVVGKAAAAADGAGALAGGQQLSGQQ